MIKDGMRTHDEPGEVKRYRMPDLLTLDEMRLYFAGTYGVDIELKTLSEEMQEKVQGVGVLAATPVVTDRDREHALLRDKLGITEIEKKLDIFTDRARELDSRTMLKEDFEAKHGEQPPVAPPEPEMDDSEPDTVVVEEEGEEKLDTEASEEIEGTERTSDTPANELENLLQRSKEENR